MSNIDIDKIVDYRREYSSAIQKHEISGTQLTGICPFHPDKNASLSVDLKTGRFKCFACDAQGNYIDFVARTLNIDTKDAYKEILRQYGVAEEKPEKPKDPAGIPYNLDIYAEEKQLPKEWLAKTFGLSSGAERAGLKYVKLPYMDESGKVILFRKRYHRDTGQRFKWSNGSKGKLMLYGLWEIDRIRERGYVVLVEGESDTQTLWHLKFPALGVPGATIMNADWVSKLDGIPKVYVHVEPDAGGQVFKKKVTAALRDGGYSGEVRTWTCSGADAKDPSALMMTKGTEEAKSYIDKALRAAKTVDITDIPENVKGAPVNLREPEGWQFSDKGISMIDAKTFEPKCICRTPIILTRRLRSDATGEEKIEIAFKRDGQWSKSTFPRSMIFQSRSIIALADQGCTVTSENAKYVVRFLQALEEENMDVIEKVESTSSFGWQTRGRFLPGHGGELVLDIDPSVISWADAYGVNGSLDAWVDQIQPLRENNRFRFIMAGSFAAPLLRILKQRIFFIYNWGSSKGGKTAAIKAALSAWGDPEGLMTNFNATQVGLERIASFFSDLPLGVDERQLAGQKQEQLEKIVYMLSSGQGRLRGAKSGGVQTMNTWRSVILASGEEPIIQENSQTGVSTRMIEVIGGPIDDEKAAAQLHETSGLNCGWAGPKFIEFILSMNEDAIRSAYSVVLESVQAKTGTGNGAHAAAIAAVTLADVLAGLAIFEPMADMKDLMKRSIEMAVEISRDIEANEPPDVNMSAVRYLIDWYNMNSQSFTDRDFREPRLGFLDNYGDICIFPTALRQALAKEGYSDRKTVKYMADEGLINADSGHNTTMRRLGGKSCRVLCINTRRLSSFLGFQGEELFDEADTKEQF